MNQLRKQYPTVLSQDVIWGDMDAFGHVNNTVYFRYFEDARLAYFNTLGMLEYKAENNIGPILANTECNFKLPLQYPDHIYIAARSKILSAKKFEMEYVIYSDNFSGIAAEGRGLLIYYDYASGKSCAIPPQLTDAISNVENSSNDVKI